MSEEILMQIAERLNNHVDRYNRDREEAQKRISTENEEKKAFRDEMTKGLKNLDERIQPIERDHFAIMRLMKWGGSVVITGLGLVKAWDWFKDHLR